MPYVDSTVVYSNCTYMQLALYSYMYPTCTYSYQFTAKKLYSDHNTPPLILTQMCQQQWREHLRDFGSHVTQHHPSRSCQPSGPPHNFVLDMVGILPEQNPATHLHANFSSITKLNPLHCVSKCARLLPFRAPSA